MLFWLAVLSAAAGSSPARAAAAGDNFDDNSRDSARWGADRILGHGVLTEKNHRLEYTCATGTLEDDAIRPWVATRFPFNADWEIQMDLVNMSKPSGSLQVNSMGFKILNTRSSTNDVFIELYSSSLGGGPGLERTGFLSELNADDTTLGTVDREGGAGVTNAAVRVTFDSVNKVLTTYYDIDARDGYQWVTNAVFGLAGSGGLDGDADWGLTDTDQFAVYIYGFSAAMAVTSGQMYADNFGQVGGVPPSGGASPDPLGNFKFTFPTGNPLLTRILSITGNYQGLSPSAVPRAYNIDVAQDDSGKIQAVGTVDGILDADGNSQISETAGAVRTVLGEPVAKIKGSFKGTKDGVASSITGHAEVPVNLVDVGGGTNGLVGTGAYSSRVGGVKFGGRNIPLNVPAPEGAGDNLQKDWSLDLSISRKRIGTKDRTVASAQLTLPNGDTIAFRERAVRYSVTRGYSISFLHGTNITLNPPKRDLRTTISLRGMTLLQQGQEWQPTAGTIKYHFLGQQGVGSLMDFLAP